MENFFIIVEEILCEYSFQTADLPIVQTVVQLLGLS